MPDLATTPRNSRKIAIIIGCACFFVILISGALRELFIQSATNQQTAASQRFMGRLHVKYAADKETPWVDVATDRETLEAWRGIFVQGHGRHRTQEEIARDYGDLMATGRLRNVEPDTLVRILKRDGESDCQVTIFSGKNRGQSGWVDCHWITD